jgi:superfamily II DNA or RNA helicase
MELVPGLYEEIINVQLHEALQRIDAELTKTGQLSGSDMHVALSAHVSKLLLRAFRTVGSEEGGQLELANRVLDTIRAQVPAALDPDEALNEPLEMLLAVLERSGTPDPPREVARPEIPLSMGALLVNGRDQPRVGHEIARELASADQVDLLCAFVKWEGLRVLETEIRTLLERAAPLRVITTTYIGATDRRAIDALVEAGAKVKVSYETRTTRLHAKAWIFKRRSGFSTAYVGSSNLSRTALLDGLEWNVRVSGTEQPVILRTFESTFENYWQDPSFEDYDPSRDAERFDAAIALERGGPSEAPIEISGLYVRPWPYQEEVLESLDAERKLHNRWRNLVVMATGTGKTVVSALDYQRLRSDNEVDTLLFIAHREEILQQSLRTFRTVMRDGSFGEMFVGGARPTEWRHVFSSIQSLSHVALEELPADRFSMVIVDEFHHAEAQTYERMLNHLRPRVLLGLTATPERTDGKDATHWFDGRIAAELRLWEAIDRGLLSPFQYFGLHDDVDLQGISWRRGRYDLEQLNSLYTGDTARALKIVQAVRDKVPDVRTMRAIGFCVGKEHARFMAERFNLSGIPSRAVTADTPREERMGALRDLRDGDLKILFAVDLFNEGVDIPQVDTVLFLRPTESATVFLQQLGRGLRLADDKACLTVLDFIGQQNAKFRFDKRFAALTGERGKRLQEAVRDQFPYLPAGCHVELDRVASQLVLDNIRHALNLPPSELVAELERLGDVSLKEFLAAGGFELEDVYRRSLGWLDLRRRAGFAEVDESQQDRHFGNAVRRMLHIDEWLTFIQGVLAADGPPSDSNYSEADRRRLAMLYFDLFGSTNSVDSLDFAPFWSSGRRQELGEVLECLQERAHHVSFPSTRPEVPLRDHATYSRDEILAGFGLRNPGSVREGVRFIAEEQTDVLFVTLRKEEGQFSPTTMYADLAVSPRLFQWETQSRTSVRSKTFDRYRRHVELGTAVQLFVRDARTNAIGETSAYLNAGTATYMSHELDRPVRILWHLDRDLPADIFQAAKAIAG